MIVTGSDKPPTLNTELFVLAAVTVTAAPLAVNVPEAVPLFPTVTLPRLRVAGLILNCPTAEDPVPESGIVSVGFDAVEVIVTLPLALPDADGVNFTVNVVLFPAASVKGVEIPVIVNPVPLTLACETVTLVPPLLVIVSDSD